MITVGLDSGRNIVPDNKLSTTDQVLVYLFPKKIVLHLTLMTIFKGCKCESLFEGEEKRFELNQQLNKRDNEPSVRSWFPILAGLLERNLITFVRSRCQLNAADE